MRKILLVFTLAFSIGFADEIYEPNSKNFKDGFEAGLQALRLQAIADGFQEKLIIIKNPYILVYNIQNTPLNESLFLQVITAREGFDTHLTRDFIFLGEYQREVDAKDAKDLLVRKYKIKADNLKIIKDRESIVTYPYLFADFYRTLLQDAKKMGVIVENNVIFSSPIKFTENVVKKPVVKKIVPKVEVKKIVLINPKAMSYVVRGKESLSTSYVENGLTSEKEYILGNYGKEILTNEGEIFVKVKDRNLYFAKSDVKIQISKEENKWVEYSFQ